MWTPATCKNYSRNGLRYQSDVTDEEWRVIEPYLLPAMGIGRPRGWPVARDCQRHFYVMRSGCPWRQLPKDLPPWSTVYRWFAAWRDARLFEKINHALVITDHELVGREASPSAAIIDSQSIAPRRLAARAVMMPARRSTGANVMRWLTRTGVALIAPHPASSIQDRDGGGLPASLLPLVSFLSSGSLLMADMPANASPPTRIIVEIVAKSPIRSALAVLPRRWVVERFFAWIGRNRRLAKDFEASIDSARVFLYAASVMLALTPHRKARMSFETDF